MADLVVAVFCGGGGGVEIPPGCSSGVWLAVGVSMGVAAREGLLLTG